MTFAELETDTFRRIREATGSGVYFSTNDIRDAINAGCREWRSRPDVQIALWAQRYRRGEIMPDAIPPEQREAVMVWLLSHPKQARRISA